MAGSWPSTPAGGAPTGSSNWTGRSRDVHELRDRVRRYALDGLADSAGGVLVIDETGFAKKGKTSVGLARQFTGSLGTCN
ncbi:transposase [Streptomyces mirabilis]|uniref:transposase n=1 Tax=Streptomyces mirabilis TaxID=68239 RepID=UPI00369568A4